MESPKHPQLLLFLTTYLDLGGGGGAVNVISSDYCCDPDIYPWGYHQHPPQCCEYYIDTQKKCQKMCEML